MCWVACDRGARLAELHGDDGLAKSWQAMADEIKSDLCEKGVDSRGVFVQHYGTKALDASVLLIPLVRFLLPKTLACGPPCWRSPTSCRSPEWALPAAPTRPIATA